MTEPEAAAGSGVAHGPVLVALAEALVGEDEEALARARAEGRTALGSEGVVDAVAVAANFERMVRIADATGIPLDGPLELVTTTLRDELGLGRFGAAANTPPAGPLRRAVGRAFGPVAFGLLRLLGRVRRRPDVA